MTQRQRHRELYEEIQRRLVEPRLEMVLAIPRAGVARGEVAPAAARVRIAAVGPRLLIAEHMESGPLSEVEVEVEVMVTEILLPLLAPR
jgi:hypothetical protein